MFIDEYKMNKSTESTLFNNNFYPFNIEDKCEINYAECNRARGGLSGQLQAPLLPGGEEGGDVPHAHT